MIQFLAGRKTRTASLGTACDLTGSRGIKCLPDPSDRSVRAILLTTSLVGHRLEGLPVDHAVYRLVYQA